MYYVETTVAELILEKLRASTIDRLLTFCNSKTPVSDVSSDSQMYKMRYPVKFVESNTRIF